MLVIAQSGTDMLVIAQSGTDMLVIAQSGTDYVDLPTLPLFYCRKSFSEWNLFYLFFLNVNFYVSSLYCDLYCIYYIYI